MELKRSEVDNVIVLELEGKIIGGGDVSTLNEAVHQDLDKGKNQFVIDLAQVDMINSSGLGLLIGALTAVRNQNGDIKLANVTEKIKNLLKITKLDKVFEIYPDVKQAVGSVVPNKTTSS